MAYNWDTGNPSDNGIVSQFPSNERAFRTAANGAFNVEHDPAEGRHKIGIGSTAARDAISTWVNGSMWINTDVGNTINVRVAGVWAGTTGGEFNAGTKIIFSQAAAPSGWTQDSNNDRVLRVVSTAGAGTGGAWAISGLNTEGAHTHSVSATSGTESATHYHVISGTSGTNSGADANCQGPAGGGCLSANANHTHAISFNSGTESATHTHNISTTSAAGSAHTHTGDGTWRPAYLDVISCAKN